MQATEGIASSLLRPVLSTQCAKRQVPFGRTTPACPFGAGCRRGPRTAWARSSRSLCQSTFCCAHPMERGKHGILAGICQSCAVERPATVLEPRVALPPTSRLSGSAATTQASGSASTRQATTAPLTRAVAHGNTAAAPVQGAAVRRQCERCHLNRCITAPGGMQLWAVGSMTLSHARAAAPRATPSGM